MSLRQYLDAVRGRLALLHLQADATAGAVARLFDASAPSSRAAELLGLPAETTTNARPDIVSLQSRRPHWFAPSAEA